MKYELMGTEAYYTFLSDKTNMEKQARFKGYLYQDLADTMLMYHPNYDYDIVHEIAIDCADRIVDSNDRKRWDMGYGEFLAHMRQKVERIYDNKKHYEIVSLDDARHFSDQGSMIADCNERLAKQQFLKDLQNCFQSLDERERRILHLRFDGNNGEGMNIMDIAELEGISHQRVDQILKKIYNRIISTCRVGKYGRHVASIYNIKSMDRSNSLYKDAIERDCDKEELALKGEIEYLEKTCNSQTRINGWPAMAYIKQMYKELEAIQDKRDGKNIGID